MSSTSNNAEQNVLTTKGKINQKKFGTIEKPAVTPQFYKALRVLTKDFATNTQNRHPIICNSRTNGGSTICLPRARAVIRINFRKISSMTDFNRTDTERDRDRLHSRSITTA